MNSKIRVLIVDDEKSIRRTLGEFLRAEGYDVAEAEDAEVAQERLREAEFDVVASDIILPRVTGVELLQRIHATSPHVQVVMMTGEPTVETATEALRAGAVDYLFKPINKAAILRAVANAARIKILEDTRRRLEEENRAHRENLERLVEERTARLRESEALYHSLVENVPQQIFRKDAAGHFMFGNEHFCSNLGRLPAEILGQTDADLFPAALAAKYRRDDQRVLATGQPFQCEEEHQQADGRRIYVHVIKTPLRNAEGRVIGVQGIAWDITERRRAECALRESEERFRTLYENALMGLYRTTPEGRILLANPALVRMLGYRSFDELSRLDLETDGFHPDGSRQEFKRRLETEGSVQGLESAWARADGSTVFVRESARAVRDDTGKVLYYDGVVEDVTERKRAEEQLRKLARAVEQSPVSIVITDAAGNIEFVNPKFTQITGYTPEEVLRRNPRFLKSGETPAAEYRHLWQTIATGQEWHGEFHNRRKDGTLFWEAASISPIRNAAGEITHFIAVKEDVTEQKLTQAKLLRAQRVESIGTLASGIAHDLNNILTPIIMCAPMLQSEEYRDSQKAMAKTIESSALRAVGIVKQLLSFARGKEGLKQTVQVRHLVRDMAKIARETFPRSIQVETFCDPDLWPVLADATQLHQVLLNLCVNARDAMPTGGKLMLSAGNVTLDEHFVAMHKEVAAGSFVRLQVIDTGTGIPEAAQAHIFESFFTTKGEGAGTGLGLATVKGIVKDHKGLVRFTTLPGRGTTFEVYLPAMPEAQSSPEHVADETIIPRGQGELVLVVDDEPAICDTTRRTLERHGYRVLEAHDGIEALAQFSSRPGEVRAVVTDLMMPLMDGVTLCRTLRRLNSAIPLIVSSGGLFGKAGGEAARAFEELGVQHVLQKPHNADVLLRSLSEVLRPATEGGVRP